MRVLGKGEETKSQSNHCRTAEGSLRACRTVLSGITSTSGRTASATTAIITMPLAVSVPGVILPSITWSTISGVCNCNRANIDASRVTALCVRVHQVAHKCHVNGAAFGANCTAEAVAHALDYGGSAETVGIGATVKGLFKAIAGILACGWYDAGLDEAASVTLAR